MSRQGVNYARLVEFKRSNIRVDIDLFIKTKSHHLLGSDAKDILVFGLESSVEYMSQTPVIFADGTFTCVIEGYSQLYIFHALIRNDVSFPMFFCLLNGKNADVYDRLLVVIEGICSTRGKNIFNKPVRVVCDFELALIKTLARKYPQVTIKCCFFHYTKNVKENVTTLMRQIKRTNRKTSHEYKVAEKTKRRLMMLPLLPVGLIGEDVLTAINDEWKSVETYSGGEFLQTINYIRRTYIGYVKSNGVFKAAIFPPTLWNVCGLKTRTNNSAESVHNRLNKKSGGGVSLFRFLMIIEGEMKRTMKRISEGCQPFTNAVEAEKNDLFALALSKLNTSRNSLQFLDMCSSIA